MVITTDLSLKVAPDFVLPLGFVVQKAAILARSGAGKTNASVVIVEELLERGQQAVILDPPGAWWGLRSSADGLREGHSILIFGGEHQDVPLAPEDGERVARFLAQTKFSAILDLSEFTDEEMTVFVEAFARTLYHVKGKQALRTPMLLVTEEADEMAPQVPQRDQARMLAAMAKIAKKGRMRGIGLLAVTQRSASLSKNVLSQIEVLIVMQTTDPRDIDAVDAWLKRQSDQNARKQLLAEISSLRQGEAYVWSPSWLSVFKKVQFRKRQTYDSSATPDPLVTLDDGPQRVATVGDMLTHMQPYLAELKARPMAGVDTDGMVMALRADIASAHAEIAHLKSLPPVIEHVPIIDEASLQLLQDMARRYETATTDLSGALARVAVQMLSEKNGQNPKTLDEFTPITANSLQFPPISTPLPKPKTENQKPQRPRSTAIMIDGTTNPPTVIKPLVKAERVLLQGLTLFPKGRTRSQLSLITGYSARSSTFTNAISFLRVRQLLRDLSDGGYQITERGEQYAELNLGDTFLSLVPGDLVAQWMTKLVRAERAVFEVLLRNPDRTAELPREDVATQSEYSAGSSTFGNALSKLRTMDLIQGSKMLRLSDTVLSLLEPA